MSANEVHERVRQYAQLPIEDVFNNLRTSNKGLDSSSVQAYRKKYGSNQFFNCTNLSLRQKIVHAYTSPFSLLLFLIVVISILTDSLLAEYPSKSNIIILFVLISLAISGLLQILQEIKKEGLNNKISSSIDRKVTVIRDGLATVINSDEIVVGDYISLRAGEAVPADIRLVDASNCYFSQSSLTGESGVVQKTSEACKTFSGSLSDYTNIAFTEMVLTSGRCTGIVLAVGEDTYFGKIQSEPNINTNSLDRETYSIAKLFFKFMALLIPIIFIATLTTKDSPLIAFAFSLSVVIGLTPELLPIVISTCLARGSFLLEKMNLAVKNLNMVQTLGAMDTLCVDKTGTLTGSTLHLEYYIDALGNESQDVLELALLNSFNHYGVSNQLDQAILSASKMPGLESRFASILDKFNKLDEIPFDYERRAVSVLVEENTERILVSKGSVDSIAKKCTSVLYNGKAVSFRGDASEDIHKIVDEMLEDGMKVLAVAYKEMNKESVDIDDESNLILAGFLVFFDAPKSSAFTAVKNLTKSNINLKVLTGDNVGVAYSICKRIGIDVDTILTGRQIEELSDDELGLKVEDTTIFAELSPQQKRKIVSALQDNGHTVGFLGDGMNDMPAILCADVGISVDTALPAVKTAADAILLEKDLGTLYKGVMLARQCFVNISKYVKITSSSNLGNILAITLASVFLPFFPMTSVQILMLNVLYDVLCLIIPWDSVDRELIKKPLEWSAISLKRFMCFFAPISTLFDAVTFVFLFFVLCPGVCGASFYSLDVASQSEFISLFQTGWFLESMWTQVMIIYSLRTEKIPLVQSLPSAVFVTMTLLGIAMITLFACSSLGISIGMCMPPVSFFVFIFIVTVSYVMLVSFMKKAYIRTYSRLL